MSIFTFLLGIGIGVGVLAEHAFNVSGRLPSIYQGLREWLGFRR